MIHGRSVCSIDALGLDEKGWNALVAESPTNSIFQSYQWASSWEKIFKEQCEPWYITVEDQSNIVGVAPLMICSGSLNKRVVKFLGDGKADYCDFLLAGARHETLKKMFDQVFSAQDRWDTIVLNSIPSESPTIAWIRDVCRKAGYCLLQRDLYQCPALLIKDHREEAARIFNKPGLRRRQNYFQRQGRLYYKTLLHGDVLPYLDRFFDQHIVRWAGTATPSLFLDKRNQAFYRELAQAMCGTGWLVLSVVELDNRPLAIHYGFDYNDRLLWYKPSFDRAYAKHSPGLVLLRYLIGNAIEQNRVEFDFTIGDEPFKARFANAIRTTVQFQIYKDPLNFALAWSRQKLGAARRSLVRV